MKCCDYGAGMLRHKIEILQQVRTPDDMGGAVTTWEVFKTTRAAIKPVGGAERWGYGRIEATVTHKIGFRYIAGILPQMRVRFNGRIFRINAVLNLEERNKWIELHCEERDGDQSGG